MDGAEQLPSTALALPPAPCWATGHFAPLILSARTTAAARSTARVTESTSAPQVVPSALVPRLPPCLETGHFAPLILSARTTAAARSTARVTESTSAPQVVPSALEVQVSHQEEHHCTRGLEAALTTMM
jgi:hypothetical protein